MEQTDRDHGARDFGSRISYDNRTDRIILGLR